MTLTEYLNTPIPRKAAFAVVIGQGLSQVYMMHLALSKQAKQANTIIADQNERLMIYNEAINFLLEHADPPTLEELNKNMDFWRVVRGLPGPEEDEPNA